jgi:hypothetical protein
MRWKNGIQTWVYNHLKFQSADCRISFALPKIAFCSARNVCRAVAPIAKGQSLGIPQLWTIPGEVLRQSGAAIRWNRIVAIRQMPTIRRNRIAKNNFSLVQCCSPRASARNREAWRCGSYAFRQQTFRYDQRSDVGSDRPFISATSSTQVMTHHGFLQVPRLSVVETVSDASRFVDFDVSILHA